MADPIIPIERMLAVTAKVLCSAVYVSGRAPEEALVNSAPSALHALQLPEVLREEVNWRLDRAEARVDVVLAMNADIAESLVAAYRAAFPDLEADWVGEIRRLASLGDVTRVARFTGDQGAMIVPSDGAFDLKFEPVELSRGPLPSTGWLPETMQGRTPGSVIRQRVGAVIDAAFAETDGYDAAILVVLRGHILGERYAAGLDANMPLESWSMGKSVMSTLIGLLVHRGVLDLDAPAPVEAWKGRDDPRGQITLRQLLNMSSGLRCTGYQEPRTEWSSNLAEHFHPYTEAINVENFAIDRMLEFAPGEIGRYRNCDTLALAAIFHERVNRAIGADPRTFPQDALFTPIGMYGLTHETDRWGRFIISGFNYGAARDWARLAQLYLHDGVWDGQRILPKNWVDFVRTPAPAWKAGNYGGQFWLNTIGEYLLPEDTFFMAGGGGQFVFMVPSLELVIVRQGHSRGWEKSKPRMRVLSGRLLEAVTGVPA